MRAREALLSMPMASLASSIDLCCSRLSLALGSLVSFPGQADYNATENSYWSLQESNLVPACIVRPNTAEEVARSVSIIAETQDCTLAVKSGGHSPASGFANIQKGVTIDLVALNSTVLSDDRELVSVGSGATWLSVYSYLDSFNISVAGGRNGLVGVGGLLLGGGISHFSPRVGWACDNVVNFEVVLADGILTNANETSHPDLYRALKGGGNNFGIVTRFDLATFSQGNISSTSIVNDISERDAVFKAFTKIADSPDFDINTSLVLSLLFNSTSKAWIFSSSAVYTKPVLDPPVFSDIVAIPSVSKTSKLTSVSALADEKATPSLDWLFATLTFEPSYDLLLDVFDILNTTLYSFNPPGGVVWSLAFEPLPSKLLSHAGKRGGNALGLKPSDGNSFVLLISALWPESISNEATERIAREVVSKVQSCADAKGLLRRFQYLNYAAPYQTPLASYGADKLGFLRNTSDHYDGSKIFQRRLVGGFKLW